MQNRARRQRIWNGVAIAVICLFCALTIVLDFLPIVYSTDEFRNRMVGKIVQQACGAIAAALLMLRLDIRLFGRVDKWLYLLPCMLIAVDNFQFSAYFSGKMQLVRTGTADILLFLGYCLAVGLFEELVFRGVLFSVLLGMFSKDKKGFLKAYVASALVFGLAHLFNGFSLGTLLQVGYTVLTGGLFAFCLIKTKNIFCCALVHGVYNFCGLLFDVQGLGAGVVFDIGTVLTMLIVSVLVGVFVLYKVWTYSDEERRVLYERMGVEITRKEDAEEE